MPIVESPTYSPSFFFKNTHINTIYAAQLRPLMQLNYERERVELPDGDFIDLDWAIKGSKQLAFLVHGLEGNARRPYMRGMMKRFETEGWDTVGMNLRGCSGEDNRLLQGYHSGKTEDLSFIIDRIAAQQRYERVVLIGFSVGGNIVLKYAGEKGFNLPSFVTEIIAFSTPCDLTACSLEFEKPKNWLYLKQFLMTLKPKAKQKHRQYPLSFNLEAVKRSRNFLEFDNAYTAPINGFKDARDYWAKASSLPHLHNIKVPTLLLNSIDDTFLAPTCFPIEVAQKSPIFHLEMPRHGGHLGYMKPDKQGFLWTEHRAWAFINQTNKGEKATNAFPPFEKKNSTFR